MQESKPSRAGALGPAFLTGFLRPSLPGLVGMLLVCGALVGTAALRLTPPFLAELELPFWLQRDHADPGWRATVAAFRAERVAAPPEAVGVFGASALESALLRSEAASQAFSAAAGRAIPVAVLCVPGIGLVEMLTQITRTKASCPGAIVIGVSPMKVGTSGSFDPQSARLGLVEPRLRTGVYLLDQWAFLAPVLEHALRSWLRTNVPLLRHPKPRARAAQGDTHGPYDEARFAADLPWRVAIVDESLARLEHPEGGLAVLEQALERLRAEGRLVVLVESVLNPRMRAALDQPAWARYQSFMTELARRHGCRYWDLVAAAELGPDDFYDIGHVGRQAARERFTRVLAERLAPLIAGDTGGAR